jgi:hypothetical protein
MLNLVVRMETARLSRVKGRKVLEALVEFMNALTL